MIKHVSEIKDSELEPIRDLVDRINKANVHTSLLELRLELCKVVVELFTIKTTD